MDGPHPPPASNKDAGHTPAFPPGRPRPPADPPATAASDNNNGEDGTNDGDEDDDGNDENVDDVDNEDDEEEELDRWKAYLSDPPTPGIAQTAERLRQSLSINGLQQLARDTPRTKSSAPPTRPASPSVPSSANRSPPLSPPRSPGQEETQVQATLAGAAKGLQRALTPKIWRPNDENPREPNDWERLFVHVVRSSLRAGLVGGGLRGTIFFLLAFMGALRRGKVPLRSLGRAYTSAPNVRFAKMMCLWAFIYKLVSNALRLLTPPPSRSSKRRGKSYARSRAVSIADTQDATLRTIGDAERRQREWEKERERRFWHRRPVYLRDPRSRVWHAYVAGALSALSILVETPGTRSSIAQQLLVRGMEGSYNILQDMKLVHVPHGAVLVFSLACGQIMWAWVNARSTLDKGYVNWILNASQACRTALTSIDEVTATGQVSDDKILCLFPNQVFPSPLQAATPTQEAVYAAVPPTKQNVVGISAGNVLALRKVLEQSRRVRAARAAFEAGTGPAPDPWDQVLHLPCAFMHPRASNHLWEPILRTYLVGKWILPVYLVLYFIPALFLRTKAFIRSPLKIVLRSLFGSLRSSLFLAAFVNLWQMVFCAPKQLQLWLLQRAWARDNLPQGFLRSLGSPHWAGPAGLATGLSLFVDDARRRSELAAYVLPKALESAWGAGKARGLLPRVPGGDVLLTMVGMSLVMGTYAQAPDHLSGLVRRVLYQFLGRN